MTYIEPAAMNVVPIRTLTTLSDDEQRTVNLLLRQLALCWPANQIKERYYEGTARIRDLGISIPPTLQSVETVVGWPTTTVDVLEERINFEGFGQPTDTDEFGLGQIVEDNHLLTEIPQGILDTIMFGVSFVAVGTGYDGEPNPLVTIESPMHTTGIYDQRLRRLTAALTMDWDPEHGIPRRVTLYLPDQTIIASRAPTSQGWAVEHRDQHGMGRVPVLRLVNRPRSSNRHGRSEITRAVRSLTDNAVRTLLGMEVAREFYGAPQRYVLGAPEAAFQDAQGNAKPAWESYLGRFLALDPGQNDDGSVRQIQAGQFEAASMEPYAGQMRLLSQLLAAESGFPASYLGFTTENPASADAIRAGEARLVKRAERRITAYKGDLTAVARIACFLRDGEWPGPGIYAQFGDPSTPTQAATTDAITKQVASGVVPARHEVTLRRLGYSPAEIKSLLAVPAAQPEPAPQPPSGAQPDA